MAPKNHNVAEQRLLYIRSVARRVCATCDVKDRCQESRHRRKFVERWMCLICFKEFISKAGAIRHMKMTHERTRAEARFDELHAKVISQMCSRE